jgi:hypothetical protein
MHIFHQVTTQVLSRITRKKNYEISKQLAIFQVFTATILKMAVICYAAHCTV